MDIKEFIETNFILEAPQDQFKEVHILECEEVLDNLGYIEIEKSKDKGPQKVNNQELLDGIKQFRTEYQIHKNKFKKDYNIPGKIDNELLTEEELDFFEELCSLEGKLNLHEYSKYEIESNSILTRVLNFRLWALAIFNKKITPFYIKETDSFLDRIGLWCGLDDHKQIIKEIGNIESLSSKIVEQSTFKNSKFRHTIYFKNKIDTIDEKKFRFKNDPNRFKSRFDHYPDRSIKSFHTIRKNKDKINAIINDDLNQLMIRLVQLRFWLIGLYQGKLDNELGPVSLKAIKDSLELYRSIYGNKKGFSINDIITYLRNDNWAINSVFLIKGFLPLLDDKEKNKVETISEEIHTLYKEINDQDKKEFINEFNNLVRESNGTPGNIQPYRKTKARGVQQLYKSISRFLRRITNDIKKGIQKVIQKVIEKLKSLFNWIKNGANILFREIKKVFNLLTAGVKFFFSERKVTSKNGKSIVITDYDFDFDNTTTIHKYDKELLQEQIKKCNWQVEALEEVADFIGTVVHIIIKIVSGPHGWLQLGIELIKWLANNAFAYNRFSFK